VSLCDAVGGVTPSTRDEAASALGWIVGFSLIVASATTTRVRAGNIGQQSRRGTNRSDSIVLFLFSLAIVRLRKMRICNPDPKAASTKVHKL
jgi:hypothetical protein